MNVWPGVVVGIVLATLYSAWAIAMYIIMRRSPAATTVTLPMAIATYYGAGAIGGALIGGLSEYRRSWPGMIMLCLIGAGTLFFCIELATTGPFWRWTTDTWTDVLTLATITGLPTAVVMKLQK